jgi:NAD-dependent SIR2 family protein deacetylase
MYTDIKQQIADAELVLVGIGEAFEMKEKSCKEAVGQCRQAYQSLENLLKDKNYFIVTLCTDGLLQETGLEHNRITAPCGSIFQMQCSMKCTGTIYEPEADLKEKICSMRLGDLEEKDLPLPVCPECGKPMVLNTIYTENYAEEGYLESWALYRKWLQGTLNRRLCILELGVGMRFPTVIRWPFEKTAYFNQKAMLYRVHDKLCQTPEELKDRSIGIPENPMEFLIVESEGKYVR